MYVLSLNTYTITLIRILFLFFTWEERCNDSIREIIIWRDTGNVVYASIVTRISYFDGPRLLVWGLDNVNCGESQCLSGRFESSVSCESLNRARNHRLVLPNNWDWPDIPAWPRDYRGKNSLLTFDKVHSHSMHILFVLLYVIYEYFDLFVSTCHFSRYLSIIDR